MESLTRFSPLVLLLVLIASPASGQPVVDTACGATVTGELTTDDTLAPSNFVGLEIPPFVWVDFFRFDGTEGDLVTITMTSSDFSPAVALFDATGGSLEGFLSAIDIPEMGSRASVRKILSRSGFFTVAAANWPGIETDPGSYDLSIDCDTGVNGGRLPSPPSNLMAKPLGSFDVGLYWQDNSNNEDEFVIDFKIGNDPFAQLATVPANTENVDVDNLLPETTYTFRVLARNSDGVSSGSNTVNATTPPLDFDACVPSTTQLCLNGGRFTVEVTWTDFEMNTGDAKVVPLPSDDSGLFYFFTESNYEMLMKVLDGCTFNNHFWVFSAATTNVAYVLTVTDSTNGEQRVYDNVLGEVAMTVTDTSAFATCP